MALLDGDGAREFETATLLDERPAATTVQGGLVTDEYRRMMVVNRAQAYQWLGENDKCQEIMGREDWSAICRIRSSLPTNVLRETSLSPVATRDAPMWEQTTTSLERTSYQQLSRCSRRFEP